MKIVESNARLRAQINKALAKQGDKVLTTAASRIQSKVREIVRVAIASSPEISSLSGGTLRLDFGLEEDPSSQIVNAIVGSVKVEVTKIRATAGRFGGGITINVQPSDFSNLFTFYCSTARKRRIYSLAVLVVDRWRYYNYSRFWC
jgi:hypothetical protein